MKLMDRFKKLLIVNQKCYNLDNPEDNVDLIHMRQPRFAGDTKNVHFVIKLGILLDFKIYTNLIKVL